MNGKRQKTHWSVALEPAGEGETLSGGPPKGRTVRGEPSTRKPGFSGTIDGGGVQPGKSRSSVETRSKE